MPGGSAQRCQEVVDQIAHIFRSGMRLWVELHGAERLAGVPDPLVRSVVGVPEPRLPALWQRILGHREAVILAGDVAAPGAQLDAGLVLAAMAPFQLVGVGTRGQGQYLVAEADPEGGHLAAVQLAHGLAPSEAPD